MEVNERIKQTTSKMFSKDREHKENVSKVKFIENYMSAHQTERQKFASYANIARLYYKNENDILRTDRFAETNKKRALVDNKNPLRNADNRVSHNWHELLLNQKAAYIGSEVPVIDTGKEESNEKLQQALGKKFKRELNHLIIDAGNTGTSWLHFWDNNGKLDFSHIDPLECFPITMNDSLVGMIRCYRSTLPDGTTGEVTEYWDDKCVRMFVKKGDKNDLLEPLQMFTLVDDVRKQSFQSNVFYHKFGRVPFIEFPNNMYRTSDLKKVKGVIDVYDKVYSGFVNDLDDIQQMIMILYNYGGEDKEEFLNDLMYYKLVKIDNDGEDDKSGLDTLTLDIPTEARDYMLKITREQIFISGQGVNPNKDNLNNNSGIALKHIYSLLELKCEGLISEFGTSLDEFIEVISDYYKLGVDTERVEQKWIRKAISNDLENAEIISRVAMVSSDEAIAKHNPIVDPRQWQDEVKAIEERRKEEQEQQMKNSYKPTSDEMAQRTKNLYKAAVGTDNQIRGRNKQMIEQKTSKKKEETTKNIDRK